MTKLDEQKKADEPKKAAKTKPTDAVYETSESVTQHNPYDTKVGGKPACTLADGTVPEAANLTASKA